MIQYQDSIATMIYQISLANKLTKKSKSQSQK